MRCFMPSFIQKLIEQLIDKKRVIGWLSAIILAVLASVAGMQTQEFKDAVCSAAVIPQKAPDAPVIPAPAMKPMVEKK